MKSTARYVAIEMNKGMESRIESELSKEVSEGESSEEFTGEFSVSSSRLLGLLMMRWGFYPLLAAFTFFLAGVALGIFLDIRWLIVAFMVLCIVIPALVAFIYFWYALKPLCSFNILPHTLRSTPDGIEVRIRVNAPISKEDSSKKSVEQEEDPADKSKAQVKEGKEPEYRTILIPRSQMQPPQIYGSGLLCFLGPTGRDGLIIFPPGFDENEKL